LGIKGTLGGIRSKKLRMMFLRGAKSRGNVRVPGIGRGRKNLRKKDTGRPIIWDKMVAEPTRKMEKGPGEV